MFVRTGNEPRRRAYTYIHVFIEIIYFNVYIVRRRLPLLRSAFIKMFHAVYSLIANKLSSGFYMQICVFTRGTTEYRIIRAYIYRMAQENLIRIIQRRFYFRARAQTKNSSLSRAHMYKKSIIYAAVYFVVNHFARCARARPQYSAVYLYIASYSIPH